MKTLLSTVFLLALAALTIQGVTAPATEGGYDIGDKAENFTLKGVDGNMHSLSDYAESNGVVIIFTCNHCPYAVMYEDRIIDLHNKYADRGFPVLAINPNDPEVVPGDSFENMIKRADEKSFPFPYVMDEGQKIYPKFGATKTPHVFLLDKEMVVRYIGAIDNSPRDASSVTETYLEDAIAAVAADKAPSPAKTKAIGCGVKCSK